MNPNPTPKDHTEAEEQSQDRFEQWLKKDLETQFLKRESAMFHWLQQTWKVQDAHYQPLIERLTKEVEELEELQATIESIEHEVSRVYCHITNGKISKPNTCAEDVIAVSDDWTIELVEKELNSLSNRILELSRENENLLDNVEEFNRQIAHQKQVIEAARELADKLRIVHQYANYCGIWTLAYTHGVIYQGPKYDIELTKLNEALKSSPPNPVEPV